MRDDHIATLAWELCGSLTAIQDRARALQHDDGRLNVAQQSEHVGVIADQAARLGRLVGNVLAASRASSSPGSAVEASHIVQGVIDEVTSFPERRRARTDLPVGLWTLVPADALRSLVLNLVTNALRFAAPGSRVEVAGWEDGDYIALEVRNVGPPIPQAYRDHIFEPFVRGVTPGDPAPGFGYGLYVVRCLLEAHGGEVTVHSTHDGMAFRVRLPAPATVMIDVTEQGRASATTAGCSGGAARTSLARTSSATAAGR